MGKRADIDTNVQSATGPLPEGVSESDPTEGSGKADAKQGNTLRLDDFELLHKGQHGDVRTARRADGSLMPAANFLFELDPERELTKFMTLFIKITSDPNLKLTNRQQFKQVEDDLYEFKRNDLSSRLFTFRHRNTWYLLSGFGNKKSDRLPQEVVQRALRLLKEAKQTIAQSDKG